MKAEELRIGNYMQDKKSRLCEVVRLSKAPDENRIEAVEGATTTYPVAPIPLTEEWLLKLGAKKSGIEYKLKASALEITIRINSGQVYCEFGNVYLGGRIQYVHELQNLVHSLCGKELEVKP